MKSSLRKQELMTVNEIRINALHFIDVIEISDVKHGEDFQPGTVPSIQCLCCFNRISVNNEGQYLWVRDGSSEGIDYNDWYLAYLIAAMKVERPEWQFRASCKYCNEELTFTKPHNCV